MQAFGFSGWVRDFFPLRKQRKITSQEGSLSFSPVFGFEDEAGILLWNPGARPASQSSRTPPGPDSSKSTPTSTWTSLLPLMPAVWGQHNIRGEKPCHGRIKATRVQQGPFWTFTSVYLSSQQHWSFFLDRMSPHSRGQDVPTHLCTAALPELSQTIWCLQPPQLFHQYFLCTHLSLHTFNLKM